MFLFHWLCFSEDPPTFKELETTEMLFPIENMQAHISLDKNWENYFGKKRERIFFQCSISVVSATFNQSYAFGNGISFCSGGALYSYKSSLYSYDTNYINCQATFGGALSLEITHTCIKGVENKTKMLGNIAYIYGGAIFSGALFDTSESTSHAASLIQAENMIFHSNVACSLGGAVFANHLLSLDFVGISFQNNTAGQSGGALYILCSKVSMYGTLFTENSVDYHSYKGKYKDSFTNKLGLKEIYRSAFRARGGGAISFVGTFKDGENTSILTQESCFKNNIIKIEQLPPTDEDYGNSDDILMDGHVEWDSIFDTFASTQLLKNVFALSKKRGEDGSAPKIKTNFIEPLLNNKHGEPQHFDKCDGAIMYNTTSPSSIIFNTNSKETKYQYTDIPSPTEFVTAEAPLTRFPYATTRSISKLPSHDMHDSMSFKTPMTYSMKPSASPSSSPSPSRSISPSPSASPSVSEVPIPIRTEFPPAPEATKNPYIGTTSVTVFTAVSTMILTEVINITKVQFETNNSFTIIETPTEIIRETFKEVGDTFTVTHTKDSTLVPTDTLITNYSTQLYTKSIIWSNILTYSHSEKETITIIKKPSPSIIDEQNRSLPTHTYLVTSTNVCMTVIDGPVMYPTTAYTRTNLNSTYMWTRHGESITWMITVPSSEYIFTNISSGTIYKATHTCEIHENKTWFEDTVTYSDTSFKWVLTNAGLPTATPIPSPSEISSESDGYLTEVLTITATNIHTNTEYLVFDAKVLCNGSSSITVRWQNGNVYTSTFTRQFLDGVETSIYTFTETSTWTRSIVNVRLDDKCPSPKITTGTTMTDSFIETKTEVYISAYFQTVTKANTIQYHSTLTYRNYTYLNTSTFLAENVTTQLTTYSTFVHKTFTNISGLPTFIDTYTMWYTKVQFNGPSLVENIYTTVPTDEYTYYEYVSNVTEFNSLTFLIDENYTTTLPPIPEDKCIIKKGYRTISLLNTAILTYSAKNILTSFKNEQSSYILTNLGRVENISTFSVNILGSTSLIKNTETVVNLNTITILTKNEEITNSVTANIVLTRVFMNTYAEVEAFDEICTNKTYTNTYIETVAAVISSTSLCWIESSKTTFNTYSKVEHYTYKSVFGSGYTIVKGSATFTTTYFKEITNTTKFISPELNYFQFSKRCGETETAKGTTTKTNTIVVFSELPTKLPPPPTPIPAATPAPTKEGIGVSVSEVKTKVSVLATSYTKSALFSFYISSTVIPVSMENTYTEYIQSTLVLTITFVPIPTIVYTQSEHSYFVYFEEPSGQDYHMSPGLIIGLSASFGLLSLILAVLAVYLFRKCREDNDMSISSSSSSSVFTKGQGLSFERNILSQNLLDIADEPPDEERDDQWIM